MICSQKEAVHLFLKKFAQPLEQMYKEGRRELM